MKNKSQMTINIDPCNPGQYFACCGILAIADRLDSQAKGWFDCPEETPRIGQFYIMSLLPDIADKIVHAFDDVEIVMERDYNDVFRNPVHLNLKQGNVGTIYLDWWLEHDYKNNSSKRKCWAGTQNLKTNILEIWLKQLADFNNEGFSNTDLFNLSSEGKTINYDPRSGLCGGLSVGFSPNKMNLKTIVYPYVEILAMIGLQYCRPDIGEDRQLSYGIWNRPLSLSIAMVALLKNSDLLVYRFKYRQIVTLDGTKTEYGNNTPCTFAEQMSSV